MPLLSERSYLLSFLSRSLLRSYLPCEPPLRESLESSSFQAIAGAARAISTAVIAIWTKQTLFIVINPLGRGNLRLHPTCCLTVYEIKLAFNKLHFTKIGPVHFNQFLYNRHFALHIFHSRSMSSSFPKTKLAMLKGIGGLGNEV